MKKQSLLFGFCFLLPTAIFSQVLEEMQPVGTAPETAATTTSAVSANAGKVSESEESMSLGTHPSLTVTLDFADAKLADKVWKDFMSDYEGKTKKMKGGDENLTAEAEIVGINGVNPLEIYSRSQVVEEGGNVEFTVWFKMGGDEWLSSNRRSQYDEAEKILKKFAFAAKKEHTRLELEDAEKKLKSLDNEMSKLKRQNENYHQAIVEAEKKIELAKENIVKNEEQQGDTTQKIDLQKQLVEEIKRRLAEMKK